jgi:hypothetical protein
VRSPHDRDAERYRAGAPRRNVHALTTGARSRRLAGLFKLVGPAGKPVVIKAITRATDDALARVPDEDTRAARAARAQARSDAFARVIDLLLDVRWSTPALGNLGVELYLAFQPIWLGHEPHPPRVDPHVLIELIDNAVRSTNTHSLQSPREHDSDPWHGNFPSVLPDDLPLDDSELPSPDRRERG